jgi:hypothetical protein
MDELIRVPLAFRLVGLSRALDLLALFGESAPSVAITGAAPASSSS